MKYPLALTVNGETHDLYVEASRSLLDVVRNDLVLTGAKEGCDDSECGACMMLLDGSTVNACSLLALQANDRAVTTVEGLSRGGALHPLQRAIVEVGGVQCGYCTPGMLMSATALLERCPRPSVDEIKIGLRGNLCRCTGYQKIIQAVQRAAEEMAL